MPGKETNSPIDGAEFVGFFCPLRAFEFIGKQPMPVRERLWFSHGLAAMIRFGKTKEEVLQTVAGQEGEIAAYEIWRLQDGRVEVETQWFRPSPPPPDCSLMEFSDLPKDARRILEEIEIHLHEAARCAAIFMPEQLIKLERITASVNEMIGELLHFGDPKTHALPAHLEGKSRPLDGNDASFHQRINQGLSHLIQLNSALAYVISQTSHGAVPILERPCLIATYSLLGVGTAYRAVSAVADYVEAVFEQHPVLWVLDNRYRNSPGVEIFRDAVRYDVEVWRKAGVGIDLFLPNSPEITRRKLSYFSLRLGFGEAHFSVTAAAQVLHAADTVRWSLMTLTHELLHAHVTGVLATVFSDTVKDGLSLDIFQRYHAQFKEHCQCAAVTEAPRLLDCLRFMIFVFVSYRQNALEKLRSLDLNPADEIKRLKLTGKLPEATEIFRSFYNESLRLLEEIIVHTLDLRYFYRGDRDLFLELLWESWTTVPAVVGDLETYLLRSLVAVATIDNGSVAYRYRMARERLLAKLRELCTRSPQNIFLKKAHDHLKDETNSARLLLLFYSALYIADMAATFLFCKAIEAKFWSDDTNIEPSEHGIPDYVLETGSFAGGRVANPIPFLANRLREGFSSGAADEEDHRSAWLLLAAASAGMPP